MPMKLIRAVAAAMSAILLAGLSAPAFAQEKPEDGEQREVHNVIIKRIGKDGDRIRIDGKEIGALVAKCTSEDRQEADVSSGEGKDKFRTRVIVCGGDRMADNGATREKLAEALDKARTRLREGDMLSEKGKAQAIEAIEREIARLRSGG